MIGFLNPVMLWALPLALAPLLLRRRKPRDPVEVPFAAMQFLKLARPQPRHHRLLTAVRIALLTALILAFARPHLSSLIPHPSSLSSVAVLPPGNLYLAAALGSHSTTGARTIDFHPTGNIQTGHLTLAAGPYFHPALQLIPSLHTVRVRRWVALPVEPRSIVLLRLSNGDPFLVETDGQIRCAVALDPDWTNLPFHPQFVPLLRELVRYLETHRPAVRPSDDFSRPLLALGLVLALVEAALAGWTRWKLIPAAVLLVLLLRPNLPLPVAPRVVTIADQTASMSVQPPPPAADRTLTGSTTDLGSALLALTNQVADEIRLYTDGQHNTGPDPVWAAAQLGRPVRIIGPPATSLRDVSIIELSGPDAAVTGQLIEVTATITSFTNRLLTVALGPLVTNVPPGTHTFRVAAVPGLHLRVTSLADEITDANNTRPVPLTLLERRHRVFLQAAAPDWEYRHVRHALAADPLIELVDEPARADEIIVTTNQTWRLRRHGAAAFDGYWRARLGRSAPATEPVVSEELYRLGVNTDLLRDIERVSGVAGRSSAGFDLRNSSLLLLALVAAFLGAWYRQRMLH
jgi:hypothetical protein